MMLWGDPSAQHFDPPAQTNPSRFWRSRTLPTRYARGCRCPDCTAAKAAYDRKYRDRVRRGLV